MTIASPMTVTFILKSQVRLKLDYFFFTCNKSDTIFLSYYIQTWHDVRAAHVTHARSRFDDLDLGGSAEANKFSIELFRQLSTQQSIRLATSVGLFFFCMTFTLHFTPLYGLTTLCLVVKAFLSKAVFNL